MKYDEYTETVYIYIFFATQSGINACMPKHTLKVITSICACWNDSLLYNL